MIENGKVVLLTLLSLSFTLCEIDESNTKYIDTILQAFKTACRPPPSPPSFSSVTVQFLHQTE